MSTAKSASASTAPILTSTNRHLAPAGKTYQSPMHAGAALRKQNRQPGATSVYIPPLHVNTYPEVLDPATGNIPLAPGADPNTYRGVQSNKSGEKQEQKVYDALYSFASQYQQNEMTVISGLQYNKVKLDCLATEYPAIKPAIQALKSQMGESDFLIIEQNLGAVYMEVKRDDAPNAIAKAQQQLDRTSQLVEILLSAIHPNMQLPFVKVIAMPECNNKASHIAADGVWYLYEDSFTQVDFTKMLNHRN